MEKRIVKCADLTHVFTTFEAEELVRAELKRVARDIRGMSRRLKEYNQDDNLLGYLEAIDDVLAMLKEAAK